MLVRQFTKNLRTGAVTDEMVEMADVATTASPDALARVQGEVNAVAIRDQARQAMTTLQAFIDNPSPTNAQVVAQLKFQARVLRKLIRLGEGMFDATD